MNGRGIASFKVFTSRTDICKIQIFNTNVFKIETYKINVFKP